MVRAWTIANLGIWSDILPFIVCMASLVLIGVHGAKRRVRPSNAVKRGLIPGLAFVAYTGWLNMIPFGSVLIQICVVAAIAAVVGHLLDNLVAREPEIRE